MSGLVCIYAEARRRGIDLRPPPAPRGPLRLSPPRRPPSRDAGFIEDLMDRAGADPDDIRRILRISGQALANLQAGRVTLSGVQRRRLRRALECGGL